jgi:hypothetical protein
METTLTPMLGQDLEIEKVLLIRSLGLFFMVENGQLYKVECARPDLQAGGGGMKHIDNVPLWELVREWPVAMEYDLVRLLALFFMNWDDAMAVRKTIEIV